MSADSSGCFHHQMIVHGMSCTMDERSICHIPNAIRSLQNSADHGNAMSQLLFAILLENGISMSPDVVLDVKYYELSALSLLSASPFSDWRVRMGIR
jgi:TPR repeat protein